MTFSDFKIAVAAQWARMQGFPLFRTDVSKDQLWDAYLGSFPAGSNPVFRKRTEYDCSCCKGFIRAVGNAVAIIDGKMESIWDIKTTEPAYQAVADHLSRIVKACGISDGFLHYEPVAGTDRNFEQILAAGTGLEEIKTWQHFTVGIPRDYVRKRADIPEALSLMRSGHEVFLRALREISLESIDTVLELIAQNSLYRGEEQQFVLEFFRALVAGFLQPGVDQELFSWDMLRKSPAAVIHIRNSVIGTLLVDLSEGKALESAVGAFEAKVAPANYKRPTALVTKGMIDKAKVQLTELGLLSALERRHATLDDITVSNILFADREIKRLRSNSVFDDLAASVPTTVKNLDKVEEVPLERFLREILPRATSLEVFLENKQAGNLVSLVTAVNPDAAQLFKWANPFSWSYAGEMADSIKERVKKAGGNVAGDLCCRLAWFNRDDLDFHMVEPNGNEIYFLNKQSYSGGQLDVDMNISGETRTPVENIFYGTRKTMPEGVYSLRVHNFNKRETVDVGFEVEVDYLGTVHHFTYSAALPNNGLIEVVQFRYSKAQGIVIVGGLPSSESVRTLWGLPSQTFHKVRVALLSPNFWDGREVGNKHIFFMLEKCLNDGTARGFFNEMLKSELDPHRKVLEMVGAKMKAAQAGDQLSGVGFSSTQRNTLIVRVQGSFNRVLKVMF